MTNVTMTTYNADEAAARKTIISSALAILLWLVLAGVWYAAILWSKMPAPRADFGDPVSLGILALRIADFCFIIAFPGFSAFFGLRELLTPTQHRWDEALIARPIGRLAVLMDTAVWLVPFVGSVVIVSWLLAW